MWYSTNNATYIICSDKKMLLKTGFITSPYRAKGIHFIIDIFNIYYIFECYLAICCTHTNTYVM